MSDPRGGPELTPFEQQLRHQLRAQAEQVQPNPETWTRVQERIRSQQRFRWLYAAAGASTLAALAVVAVLVVPGLFDRSDVEFEPPVATQPEETTEPTLDSGVSLGDVDPMLLATDSGLVALVSGDAAVIEGTEGLAADAVAVVPGSSPDALDAVVGADCGLQRVQRDAGETRVEDMALFSAGACASGPRFSPDGEHLAWIEGSEGDFQLVAVGWGDAAARERNASYGIELPAGYSDVRIADWGWIDGQQDGSLQGFIILAAKDAEGLATTFALDIERQSDGALAVPGGSLPGSLDEGFSRVVAYQHHGCAAEPIGRCTEGEIWTLRVQAETLQLLHEDEGERVWGAGGSDLDIIDPDAGRVWLEAFRGGALVGDGVGRAVVLIGEDSWSQLVLPGLEDVQVLAAANMAPPLPASPAPAPTAATEQPTAETTPSPQPTVELTAEPSPEVTTPPPVEASEEALPEAVARMRRQIMAAAQSGDLDALAALADPATFTYSFGDSGDPAAYWRAEMDNGVDVPGQTLGILNLMHTEVDEGGDYIYVWPFAYDRPYESLASAELQALEAAIGPEMMAFYEDSGQYIGYRLGIREDGTWLYLIAGD